ncbi:tetratricopeptide repeat protein [Streptomyces sp. NPDC050085]|uniref:tetratricopeptide repeat protein n=1 Tax=Streptomyces sp. NPDC050085 TaxID=3365600 RepID=UPI0037B688E2
MQENDGQSVLPAYERAQVLLRAGELGQARAEARTGLDEHGPHAGLYAVLGRAHAAEDEDDHDSAAERAYRAGLEAFPDDLDLLAAYAEFGLAGDVMEQPGRVARGRKAADRLRELAPDSPQARQAGSGPGPKPPSEARVQRHDVRTALAPGVTASAAAEAAAEAAAAWPYDRRLAVRAATLAELARPVAAPARVVVRSPYLTALLLAVAVSALLLTVTALELPSWTLLAVLLLTAPVRHEQMLLRRARRRAQAGLPVEHREPAPGAPEIPGVSPRQKLMAAGAALILVASAGGSAAWGHARSTAYPHYEASVPRSFHGMQLSQDDPLGDYLESSMEETTLPPGAHPFSGLYRDEDSGDSITLVGATGDLHAEDPDDLFLAAEDGLGEGTVDFWSIDPGPLGGRAECTSLRTGSGTQGMCTWLDKGSVGTVITRITGSDDRAALARLTRELRRATLRPTERGAA